MTSLIVLQDTKLALCEECDFSRGEWGSEGDGLRCTHPNSPYRDQLKQPRACMLGTAIRTADSICPRKDEYGIRFGLAKPEAPRAGCGGSTSVEDTLPAVPLTPEQQARIEETRKNRKPLSVRGVGVSHVIYLPKVRRG